MTAERSSSVKFTSESQSLVTDETRYPEVGFGQFIQHGQQCLEATISFCPQQQTDRAQEVESSVTCEVASVPIVQN